MNILLVNDDGYNSKGINILKEAINKYGNIYIIAPESQRSGASHSFTYRGPFYLNKMKENEYSLNALPVDCVRLAKVLDVDFDLVISGINDGLNLGTDILYSGTLGAAREALIENIPAVAISTDIDSFDIVEKEISEVLKLVFEKKLYSKRYVLNINFPTKNYVSSKGIKVTKAGKKIFDTIFVKNEDHYDVSYELVTLDKKTDTDVNLAEEGYITMVPVGLNETNKNGIKILKDKLDR